MGVDSFAGSRRGAMIRWFRFEFTKQKCQSVAIDQLDLAALGKVPGFGGELTRGDDKTASCMVCGDDSVKLSNCWCTDAASPPVLALDQERFAVFGKEKINAAVTTTATRFGDFVSAASERFAY
jgi:hypothetical protein